MSFLLANVFFFFVFAPVSIDCSHEPAEAVGVQQQHGHRSAASLEPVQRCALAVGRDDRERRAATAMAMLRHLSSSKGKPERSRGGEHSRFFSISFFPGTGKRKPEILQNVFFWGGGGERGVGVVKNGLHSVANGDGESGKPQPTAQRKTPGASSSAEHSDSTAARAASARRSSLSSGVS